MWFELKDWLNKSEPSDFLISWKTACQQDMTCELISGGNILGDFSAIGNKQFLSPTELHQQKANVIINLL